jgi:uncharacterized surface protein with fasciclin (FAS1) repeats
MKTRQRLTALVAGLVLAVATVLVTAAPAEAKTRNSLGNRSLAALLAKDGSGFDHNWYDYDILDAAVQAVLKADPNSPVKVLADGSVPLTAFLPTDQAFRRLATDLTRKKYDSESAVFAAVASLGVPTVEKVLLYHVVPGATISYGAALRANGAKLNTALSGTTITVKVRYCFFVQLVDNDPDAANPYVIQPNLNYGNVQIAHGINRVLRPVNL